MNASCHIDVASGPTIVLMASSFFIVAFVFGGGVRRRTDTVTHARPPFDRRPSGRHGAKVSLRWARQPTEEGEL